MRRWFCHFAALMLATAGAGTVLGGDYLPKVGPPPLRFEEAASPGIPRYVLPPLDPPPAPVSPAAKTNSPPVPEPAPRTVPNEPAVPAAVEPPVVLNVLPTWPTNVPQFNPPESPLSPQMFLHYFSRGTGSNGLSGSVFVPMNFLPPLPLVAPSSSASYEVAPAPKSR